MHIRRTAFAVVIAIVVPAAGAARAQGFQQYSYPDAGFVAQFPAQPVVSEIRYSAGEVGGPAKVYAAHQNTADFSVTVVDLSASPVVGEAAVEAAVKALGAAGQVKLDVRSRIDRQFGRELSVAGKDGGQQTSAVFYVGKKLYVLTGKTGPDSSALAVRFQQSLEFISADGSRPRRPEDGPGPGDRGPGDRGLGGRRFGPPPGEVADGGDVAGQGGEGRGRPPAQAFADCTGKAEGAAVQHKTPRGDVVAATCVVTPEGLAARPSGPFRGLPREGEAPPEG